MNWFKHDSNASTDAKIKKLILKYGTDGYAIYFHCIELIVSDVSENNITFSLEHDSEIIADNLKIKGTQEQSGVARVEEIMRYIINSGLFEENNGHITCYKILKRLDSSMTSNQKMRKMITSAKESYDDVMISHDDVMQEERRRDRIEEKEEIIKNTIPAKPAKKVRNKYGEYKHVLLDQEQYSKLLEEWGEPETKRMIKELDEGIETKGYKYKNFYLALKTWKKREKTMSTNRNKTVQADQMTETVQGFKCN